MKMLNHNEGASETWWITAARVLAPLANRRTPVETARIRRSQRLYKSLIYWQPFGGAPYSPSSRQSEHESYFFALDIPAATFYSYKLIRNGIFTHFVQIKCKSMITKLLFCFINTITDFLFNIRFIFESLSINKSIRHFICTLIEFDA